MTNPTADSAADVRHPFAIWQRGGLPDAALDMAGSASARSLQRQHELLDVAQTLFGRWCQRRHGTAEAAMGLSRALLAGSRGQANVADAWVVWYRGAAERLSEDAADQAEAVHALLRAWTGDPSPLPQPGSDEPAAVVERALGDSDVITSRKRTA